MKGLDLKPREGFATEFFRIKSEIELLSDRPGSSSSDFFSSFGTTEFLLRQSIVPIVAWNKGDDEARCIGTGFFISASGYLLTAAHVLRDPIDENYSSVTEIENGTHKLSDSLVFGAMLPANPAMRNAPLDIHPAMREANWFLCPFQWTSHWGGNLESPLFHQRPEFRLLHDVGLCKVREQPLIGPYQPLNIGLHSVAIGDRAVAIGYAEMRNIRLEGDDYQPELFVSVGAVTNILPDNISKKQNSTPGPNFEFNAKIPGKMSGGPILVGGGALTKGVVSRSWQDENHATGCLIAPMMSLPIVNGTSLFDLQQNGNEGIARIIGPDL
ncbi:serine protease [Hyphomonas sp.]|uniref:S1 family peptidase n=1 Tax=Hyphomonas sp. TaxID=87 RepID=UPI003528EECD